MRSRLAGTKLQKCTVRVNRCSVVAGLLELPSTLDNRHRIVRAFGRALRGALGTDPRRNEDYEKKFGYIFIVCATGKSAAQMLGLLKARLANDAEAELDIAAEEQAKITEIRLRKLLAG